jgi:hypothetical protein
MSAPLKAGGRSAHSKGGRAGACGITPHGAFWAHSSRLFSIYFNDLPKILFLPLAVLILRTARGIYSARQGRPRATRYTEHIE